MFPLLYLSNDLKLNQILLGFSIGFTHADIFHLKHFYLMVGMNKEAIRIRCSLCIYDTVLCEKYVIHAVNCRHAGHS